VEFQRSVKSPVVCRTGARQTTAEATFRWSFRGILRKMWVYRRDVSERKKYLKNSQYSRTAMGVTRIYGARSPHPGSSKNHFSRGRR